MTVCQTSLASGNTKFME